VTAAADRARARSNGRRAAKTLQQLLDKIGWDPRETAPGVFRVSFEVDAIPVSDAIACVRTDAERFVFYLELAPRAAPRRRAEVAEFVTRANWGLLVGNFEMSYGDGTVRFKVSLDFTQVELTELLVRNCMVDAMETMQHYGPHLVAVIEGKKRARAAITQAEG
jgi:hypothetical protein